MLQEGTRPEHIASPDERLQAFSTPASLEHGSLIVFRFGLPSKFLGMNITLNRVWFAQLKSPRFTRIVALPGTYELGAAFSSFAANKSCPAALPVEIVSGRITIVGIAVGMPKKWRWWRLGSKENWRDQIYMTNAPDTALQQTMQYLATIPMVLADDVKFPLTSPV